jgi:hypothetical protein
MQHGKSGLEAQIEELKRELNEARLKIGELRGDIAVAKISIRTIRDCDRTDEHTRQFIDTIVLPSFRDQG